MRLHITGVICLFSSVLLAAPLHANEAVKGLAQSQGLSACQTALTTECRTYLEGIVDGALMYVHESRSKSLSDHDFEARALKFRAGGRYKSLNKAYCSKKMINPDEVVFAIEEQLELQAITSLDEMKVFMTSMLKCNNP
jgi:hypothetical protein